MAGIYMRAIARIIAPVWGIVGISLILLYAIGRLSGFALQALGQALTPWHFLVLAVVSIFMAYAEGYRGFQCRFSPRVVARILYLHRHPTFGNGVLAPLFCIGYFAATRRTLASIWGGTLAIVALVVLVHQLEQPWRGILDTGVVIGLTWGLVSLWMIAIRVFQEGRYRCSPEVPGFVMECPESGSNPARAG